MLSLAPAAFAQPNAEQRPDSFVDAASVAPGLIVEARYAGAHNFVGRPIDGYEKPICYLTKPAAAALAQVVADLEPRGLTHQGVRLLSAGAGGGAFRALGAQPRRREDEGRSSIRTSTRARCSGTAISRRDPATRAARPRT